MTKKRKDSTKKCYFFGILKENEYFCVDCLIWGLKKAYYPPKKTDFQDVLDHISIEDGDSTDIDNDYLVLCCPLGILQDS